MADERNCDTCKHHAVGEDQWPCRSCGFERSGHAFDKWEPIAAQSKPAASVPAAEPVDLSLIVSALEHSEPKAKHYPEPVARHAAALGAARRLEANAALATSAPAAPAEPFVPVLEYSAEDIVKSEEAWFQKGYEAGKKAAPAVPAQRAELASEAKRLLKAIPAGALRPTLDRLVEPIIAAIDRLAASSEPAGTASAQEPIGFVPVHPCKGPLWMDAYGAADAAGINERRPKSYPHMALFAATTPSTAAATRVDALLPTIKGASLSGDYVFVTPAGWGSDKAVEVRDAILAVFPVDPTCTPRPDAAMQRAAQDDATDSAQTGEAAK